MIALVWVFTGIEASVVVSGRAKYAKDVGRASAIGFIGVFVLYLLISVLSLGINAACRNGRARHASMAGILEHAIGP